MREYTILKAILEKEAKTKPQQKEENSFSRVKRDLEGVYTFFAFLLIILFLTILKPLILSWRIS